jgi:hypothetical protein
VWPGSPAARSAQAPRARPPRPGAAAGQQGHVRVVGLRQRRHGGPRGARRPDAGGCMGSSRVRGGVRSARPSRCSSAWPLLAWSPRAQTFCARSCAPRDRTCLAPPKGASSATSEKNDTSLRVESARPVRAATASGTGRRVRGGLRQGRQPGELGRISAQRQHCQHCQHQQGAGRAHLPPPAARPPRWCCGSGCCVSAGADAHGGRLRRAAPPAPPAPPSASRAAGRLARRPPWRGPADPQTSCRRRRGLPRRGSRALLAGVGPAAQSRLHRRARRC